MTKNRGYTPLYPGGNAKLRGMSAIKVSKALEEGEVRVRFEERRREALLALVQAFKYLLATLGQTLKDAKLEQSLSTSENPLEWTVRIYWKDELAKKLPDEKQRKLTDFI